MGTSGPYQVLLQQFRVHSGQYGAARGLHEDPVVLCEADARFQGRPVLHHLGYDGVILRKFKELLGDCQRSQTLGYAVGLLCSSSVHCLSKHF